MYQKGNVALGGLVVVLALFFLWLLVYVPLFGVHWNIGSGTQVGYVSAIEKGGLLFKTGTAFIKPTLESTQEDIYCVISEEVFAKLKEVSVSKQRVEVSHISYFSAGVKNCAGEGVIIVGVKELQ